MLILKAALFTLAVAGSLIGLIPALIVHAEPPAAVALPAARHAGWPLVAGGVALVLWCAIAFVRNGGTPAPMAPPRRLVASGLFRLTRNPMYVGVVAAILGEALAFWSRPLLYHALATWLCIHAFVVFYEEPGLERRFGDAYRRYRRTVPRWLGWPSAASGHPDHDACPPG